MTYEEVLSAIHSRKAFSSGGASLSRMGRLMARLGNPQDAIKTIHVAGTNGKGSTCAMVESVLRAAGYRVGLFTSPYLVDFRERIQFNRENISKDLLTEAFEAVMAEESALEQAGFEPINEFELVSAMGFYAFAKARVDYAVVEVGLGGRYDATNIIAKPEACCITPISLDHTGILGNTVPEIAYEKAGIIKPGVPLVAARQRGDALDVFRKETDRLIVPEEPVLLSETPEGQRFLYKGEAYAIPLLGRYQLGNAAAAMEICRLLGVDDGAVKSGLAQVDWPGRLQYIPGKPGVLIDAGHNPAGIEALCNALDTLFAGKTVIAVMAMMRDKDYAVCIPEVAKRSRLLVASTVGLPRSLSPEALAQEGRAFCDVVISTSVAEGVRTAKRMAGDDDLILVCGSVYAAGDALRVMR